jgi:hypothetical protein
VVCSILSTLPVGERTNALLPCMIVAVFYKRMSVRGIAIAFLVGAAAAAFLLPSFKAEQSDNQDGLDLIETTVDGDFSRSQVLADVVDRSPMIGTRTLPYPGSGYLYSLFFFVPRSLVPFKGNSTGIEYTAAVTSTPSSVLGWGLGVGAIEEIILNFGLLAALPGLVVCGMVVRLADTLSDAIPASGVGLRLAAIWMCGYHLPALLQEFGAMVLVTLILSRCFSTNQWSRCGYRTLRATV